MAILKVRLGLMGENPADGVRNGNVFYPVVVNCAKLLGPTLELYNQLMLGVGFVFGTEVGRSPSPVPQLPSLAVQPLPPNHRMTVEKKMLTQPHGFYKQNSSVLLLSLVSVNPHSSPLSKLRNGSV